MALKYVWSFSLILLVGCVKENEPALSDDILHYDTANQDAPLLIRGISYPAVVYPDVVIRDKVPLAQNIEGIEYYIADRPLLIKLMIFEYQAQNSSEPGNLVYEKELDNIRSNRWNYFELDQVIQIPNNGFWIAFEIDAGDNDLRVIGCDRGPRDERGDLYGVFGGNAPGWTDLYRFSNGLININWNIRVKTN